VKLSEAIRLGAMMRPQTRGRMRSLGGWTCALGAALDAVGDLDARMPNAESIQRVVAKWPIAASLVQHPANVYWSSMKSIIVDLNDEHKWTREQIASWVETVELQQAADAVASCGRQPEPSTCA
jgi:hypothetical protein